MKLFFVAIVVACLSMLSACGNLQEVREAKLEPAFQGRPIEFSAVRPTKDEVVPRGYEVPNRSIFVQQTSGGSAVVGLLFGPLGVLANAANIDRITKEKGESGASSALYTIDAKDEAERALKANIAGLESKNSSEKIILKPYIVYFIADEKTGIDVLVQMRAESNTISEGNKRLWIGTYSVYLKDSLPFALLSGTLDQTQAADLKLKIRDAYVEAFGVLEKDIGKAKPNARDIAWVNSRVIGGMPGDIERNEKGHLVLRAMWGDFGRQYNAIVFQNDSQFAFSNGPVARERK